MKSSNKPPRYSRFISYGGLGHKDVKSVVGERRDKKSFRRWMRKKGKEEE